ncbi:hypothetical protein Lnau_2395 [Legionella nautarum]|uniref:Uncharacterized protein n=1 Tax=Legionella nautarum TaxID=45070 RepID=A0A0W0WKA2_9GAMM|nr:hypothetical protein [Legionella nautarum]KTD32747.1 hypothetical protein Lnau_2395 [Legionella nautarum]
MAKGSSTLNILGGLILKSTKPGNAQEKNKVRDAEKKKKHAPAQTANFSANPVSAPVRNPIKPNELNMADELKGILTPKKGGPTLTPKS